MSLEISVRLRYLNQAKGVKLWERMKRCPIHWESNIYIHAKLPGEVAKIDGRKSRKRRPKILNTRDEHKMTRTLLMLRETLGSFSLAQLKHESEVDHLLDNTIIRILKRNNYDYLQWWKKRLMSRHNARIRLLFSRKVKRFLSGDFWTNDIGFCFDGAWWTHKSNSCDHGITKMWPSWMNYCNSSE